MEKIQLRTVAQTLNYDLFEMHSKNRVLVESDGFKPRSDLIASMRQHGFLETGHIICMLQKNGKLLILAGHNRFVTAKHLGLPIWYSAHPANANITPLEESLTIRPWKAKDYSGAHAQDQADYAEVMSYHRRTGIPNMACFSMYAGQTAASSGNINDVVKSGAFKIKNRDVPFVVGKIFEALTKHCAFGNTSSLVNAISRAYFAEGFDPNRMIEKIKRRPELIKKCRSVSDYEAMLEEIYNYATKAEKFHLRVAIETAMRIRQSTPPKSSM